MSRGVDNYTLDVVISVGYRVMSLRGTQFRIWATRTLCEHLVCGFTVYERRLAERGLGEARKTLDLLSRTLLNQALVLGASSSSRSRTRCRRMRRIKSPASSIPFNYDAE